MDFLRLLAEFRTPVLDTIFQLLTYLAQETLVVVIICWLYWCQNKKLAYTLGFTYFFSGLFVQGLKLTFRIPRPWILDPEFQPVASAVPAATGYSFPSGHTQSGTALFSTLGFHTRKKSWRFTFLFLILLIGFSRMYLGVHTPKDVLTAMLITLVISYIIYHVFSDTICEPRKVPVFTFSLLLCCILLFIYSVYLYVTGTADPNMAEDALIACGAGLGFALGYFLERRYINFVLPQTAKEKAQRFGIGLISVIILKILFKYTLHMNLVGHIISYILLILWIVAGYPACFSYVQSKRAR